MNDTNVMDWRTYTIDPEGEVILALINDDDGPFVGSVGRIVSSRKSSRG